MSRARTPSPSFMIAPVPNCFSMWLTARARARWRSDSLSVLIRLSAWQDWVCSARDLPEATVEPYHPAQNAGGRRLRAQRDRGIGRVGRLEHELVPVLTQKLHRRFLPEQGYYNVSGIARVLLSHDHVVTRKDPRADHAVSSDAQGEIRLPVVFRWLEGERALPVLHREHGRTGHDPPQNRDPFL